MTMKYHELKPFIVRLALYGVKKEYDPMAVADLEEELNARPHIRNFRVRWENESQPVQIDVEVEGLNEKISEQMAEEMFEIASAVLQDIEGMHVLVKDAFLKS